VLGLGEGDPGELVGAGGPRYGPMYQLGTQRQKSVFQILQVESSGQQTEGSVALASTGDSMPPHESSHNSACSTCKTRFHGMRHAAACNLVHAIMPKVSPESAQIHQAASSAPGGNTCLRLLGVIAPCTWCTRTKQSGSAVSCISTAHFSCQIKKTTTTRQLAVG
jgi:hypothetical protein